MKMETVKLNDGVEIPVYGFGTYQISKTRPGVSGRCWTPQP